ncbi:MAG: hypothetical protein AAGA18_13925 [Verrucomicrobiota bacterium]
MYNFLVSANEGAWDGEPWSLERSRFLEYTEKDTSNKYKELGEELLAEIIEMPAIFAYESGCFKDPCFGFIRSVRKLRGRPIMLRIEYELVSLPAFLSYKNLEEESLQDALDIGGWELNRTHWAIKDVNLIAELAKKGIFLPTWVQGKPDDYVNSAHIAALKSIESKSFDLSKLIRLCEEINLAYSNGSYFSVLMLLRAILDHVPPIFGQPDFNQVTSQYGGVKDNRSFKSLMSTLNKGARKLADEVMHKKIGRRVTLPTHQQVEFRQYLDRLLQEIIATLDIE